MTKINPDEVFQFEKDFCTGAIYHHHIGHINLAEGHTARILFGPKGVIIAVPTKALIDGVVVTIPSLQPGLCKEYTKDDVSE